MYIPAPFEVTDLAKLHDFIEAYAFCTLVSAADQSFIGSHLPMLLDRERQNGPLVSGVAKANPHWREFDGTSESMAIFAGPHAYISPNWYAKSPAVPTWNYAVVHAYGRPHILEDSATVSALLDRMVARFESGLVAPWTGSTAEELEMKQRLMPAIVAFEMPIDRIEGKFKLGQNRSPEDQARMLQSLKSQPDADSRALAKFIQDQ